MRVFKTLETYLRDVKADEKRKQQERAWDLHLDCWTQQAIADEIGVPRSTVEGWMTKIVSDTEFVKAPESRQHFDVWNFTKAN